MIRIVTVLAGAVVAVLATPTASSAELTQVERVQAAESPRPTKQEAFL